MVFVRSVALGLGRRTEGPFTKPKKSFFRTLDSLCWAGQNECRMGRKASLVLYSINLDCTSGSAQLEGLFKSGKLCDERSLLGRKF